MSLISLIVPMFDEAPRIEGTLAAIESFLRAFPHDVEVLVVDDGSTDDGAERVRRLVPRFGTRLELIELEHRGKGHAVRVGMRAARGDVLVFSDADLSAPIEQLGALVAPILEGRSDIVIGSRAVDRSLVRERQNWVRESLGKGFNRVVRGVLRLPYRDTQCGFKAFSRAAARALFAMQRIDGFAFDAEILFLALRRGWRVEELPVLWYNRAGSKVHVVLAPLEMLRDTLLVRVHQWRDRYRTDPEEAWTA
jgi:dolichyl-phosphate beta-glucosyltransferase